MKKIILVATLLTLVGCSTDQVKWAMGTMSSTDAAIIECKKIGYVEGTTEYRECVQIQAVSIRNSRR